MTIDVDTVGHCVRLSISQTSFINDSRSVHSTPSVYDQAWFEHVMTTMTSGLVMTCGNALSWKMCGTRVGGFFVAVPVSCGTRCVRDDQLDTHPHVKTRRNKRCKNMMRCKWSVVYPESVPNEKSAFDCAMAARQSQQESARST